MIPGFFAAGAGEGGGGGDLAAAIMADSPWAYYKLDEAASPAPTSIADSSGNSRHLGVITGTPDFEQAELFTGGGPAMRVIGSGSTGERVASDNNTYGSAIDAAFNGDKAYTLMAVLKTAALGSGVFIHVGNYALSNGQGFWISMDASGRLATGCFSGSWESVQSAPGDLVNGQACIVHATRAVGGAVKLYLDGVQIATGTMGHQRAGAGSGSGGMRLSVGAASSGSSIENAVSATLQHAAIFAAALSGAQVLAHAEAAGFA